MIDEHRAEDLLLRDRHVGRHVGEDRRAHEVAPVEAVRRLGAAGHEPGALLLALLDVAAHALALRVRDERAERAAVLERVAGRERLLGDRRRDPLGLPSLSRGTSMRVSALQVWPELRKHFATPSVTACSRSASSRMTFGDLPPSSSATGFGAWAASSETRRPARVEPVNDTMSVSGCETIASPTTGPVPVTRLKTPAGRPDLVDDLRQHERVQRHDLARLQHDRAAGGQRRRDLVARSGGAGSSRA